VGSELFSDAKQCVTVIPVGDEQLAEALKLTQAIRAEGKRCELVTRGNMGKKMKRAEKAGATVVLILGDSEVANGEVTTKILACGTQEQVKRDEISAWLTQQKL